MKEFVVLYIFHPNENKVYYLKKNRPNIPWLHNKWLGFGGKIENYDKDLFDATIREIKEELNIEIKKENLILRGYLYDSKNDHKVYILTTKYLKILNEGLIENEGIAEYKELDYHKKHPKEFPVGNLKYMNQLLFSDEYIEINL